jgi:hypothetical protein
VLLREVSDESGKTLGRSEDKKQAQENIGFS